MQQNVDHLLEAIWTLAEEGVRSREEVCRRGKIQNIEKVLHVLEKDGLVRIENGEVLLQDKGRQRAESLIRRHRLAERLLSDVLQVSDQEMARQACQFEHILSPEVTTSVCTFLGHPPVCPHGMPIPPGECCAKFQKAVTPLVRRLKDLEIGGRARIVFIVPDSDARLSRLSTLGIVPGNLIRLVQRKPSYVVEVDETTLALDSKIVEEIYVKAA